MLALVIVVLAGTGINYYLKYFKPNVTGNKDYLFIPTGSDFKDVYSIISSENIVKDTLSFLNAAQNMDYPVKVKPGRYRLTKDMSNRSLINMLKAGNQEPVKISFQNVRLKHTLAGMISKKIESDSASISQLLDSTAFILCSSPIPMKFIGIRTLKNSSFVCMQNILNSGMPNVRLKQLQLISVNLK